MTGFLPCNYLAMEDGEFYDLKAHGGKVAIKGSTGCFKPAKDIYQAQRALLNMMSCYRQVWPENYTAEVLYR